MNQSALIQAAESKYQNRLEIFFTGIFNDKNLPSHGLSHHRRVWKYALEILNHKHFDDLGNDQTLAEKLIIACYLHDIGMSVDSGLRHGRISSGFCKLFLEECNLSISDYHDVISTIENHDNKDYLTSAEPNFMLSILSLADDLDAFGFTGIFRYAEIYLKRNTEFKKLGKQVLENAAVRFENFRRSFSSIDPVFIRHTERYEILKQFFTGYNAQSAEYNINTKSASGYHGVIEIISEGLIDPDSPGDILRNNKKFSSDPIIKWFIRGLEDEKKNF